VGRAARRRQCVARCGHVLAYLGHEYDRGASLVEQAVALNPNLAIGLVQLQLLAIAHFGAMMDFVATGA
jgi:hypothetical protein